MPRLLVVDDEQSVRDTLTYSLSRMGYEVVAAENGARALEAFNQQPVDAALIDLLMPAIDGLQLCRMLREKAAAAGRDLPVWIITGARSREAEAASVQAGARALIGKPFQWVEFQAMLESEFARPPAAPPPTVPPAA